MKEVAIYVEGGGDTAQQRAELRNGMDRLLNTQKQAAREKQLRWKLVPSGGRQSTYDAFINAVRQANRETLCVLLVDSECPIAHRFSLIIDPPLRGWRRRNSVSGALEAFASIRPLPLRFNPARCRVRRNARLPDLVGRRSP